MGRPASIATTLFIAKNGSASPALPSITYHASVVCTVPRYQLFRKFVPVGDCGTAQYAASVCADVEEAFFSDVPGAHAHFSAMVSIGSVSVVPVIEGRTDSESPLPLSEPIRRALDPARGRSVRPGISRASGVRAPFVLTSYAFPEMPLAARSLRIMRPSGRSTSLKTPAAHERISFAPVPS